MKAGTVVLLIASHCAVAALGFGLGIYALPIITAPPAPSESDIQAMSSQAEYTAEFRRDLQDSDALHWGEGTVSVGRQSIAFMGRLAPGPDYQLYLTRELVTSEADFLPLKDDAARIGPVKTFDNFILQIPKGVDPADYGAVVVWCETFSEFITAAAYR